MGNERSIQGFKRLQHIPGNVDGYTEMRAMVYQGRPEKGPNLSPLADLGPVLTGSKG